MPFTEQDKRLIAWMNHMLGLRVFYVDEAPLTCSTCPTCAQPIASKERQRRVREGVVTKIYDCLMIVNLKLDDGTSLSGVHPSHVGVEHGIEGVHCGYFFPVSGMWPQSSEEPKEAPCK